MSGPRVLLIADGGPEIGGGHVMRMLTLAEALRRLGARPTMLAPASCLGLMEAFAGPMSAYVLTRTNSVEETEEVGAKLAADVEIVVFDHFRLAAVHHRAVSRDRPSAAVDDLADRPLGVDLIADPGPDRIPDHYARWSQARLLLGPDYALVRPEFAVARPAALSRRGRARPVARLMVSLGLTDVGGITRGAVEALLPALGADARLDVVVGPGAPSLGWLEQTASVDRRVVVHAPARDMVQLTTEADLVVGAGGSSVFERCVLGAPSVLLVLADNQLPNARALERRGAAQVIDARRPGFEASLAEATAALLADAGARHAMSEAAAAVCDGQGAARVARAVLSLKA